MGLFYPVLKLHPQDFCLSQGLCRGSERYGLERDPHSLPMCRVMTAISVKGQKLLLWKSLLCPAAHLQIQKHCPKAHPAPFQSLLGALDMGMSHAQTHGIYWKKGMRLDRTWRSRAHRGTFSQPHASYFPWPLQLSLSGTWYVKDIPINLTSLVLFLPGTLPNSLTHSPLTCTSSWSLAGADELE